MDSTEAKIIEATISCIEKHGIARVTNKLISEEAGVNSAAISYYFRSKDKLIELAQQTALKNGFEWEDYAHTDELGAKEQLVSVLLQLAEGAARYPNLTKFFFTDAFLNGDYSGAGIRKLEEFLSLLREKLSGKRPDISDMCLLVHQAFNCAVLPVVTMPKLFGGFSGLDLSDSEARARYIRDAVARLWREE